MKPRNREINIFNMSLLDILCGALGTFCFLMLVLFPFYKPNQGSVQPPEPKGVDPKTYTEAMARIRDLEAKLNSCRTQAQDCRDQQQKADKQIRTLEMRSPLIISAMFEGPDDFDLYVEDDDTNAAGQKAPRVDGLRKQDVFWPGDRHLDCTGGPCTEIWEIRDTPAGDYRVYYKLTKKTGTANTVVQSAVVLPSIDASVTLPGATLTRAAEVVKVATITVKPDHHVTVRVDAQQNQQK